MTLYREHTYAMVKHLDEKRLVKRSDHSLPSSANPSHAGTTTSSSSPVARRSGSRATVQSEPLHDASSQRCPLMLNKGFELGAFPRELLSHQDYDYPPQTAIFRGYPGQFNDSSYYLGQEERQQQALEREQRALTMQQHFAALRGGGMHLTGYEPPSATPARDEVPSRRDSGIAPERTRPMPTFNNVRSVSSTSAVVMPHTFQEFFPKSRPPPIETKHEPETYAELLIHSAPLHVKDPRIEARSAREPVNKPLELSEMTDEELRLSVPLVSQHPVPKVRGRHDVADAQYVKDLEDWWNSGRKDFEATNAYAKTLLGGRGQLEDEKAVVGTTLMVGIFKTLQGYQQNCDHFSRWNQAPGESE